MINDLRKRRIYLRPIKLLSSSTILYCKELTGRVWIIVYDFTCHIIEYFKRKVENNNIVLFFFPPRNFAKYDICFIERVDRQRRDFLTLYRIIHRLRYCYAATGGTRSRNAGGREKVCSESHNTLWRILERARYYWLSTRRFLFTRRFIFLEDDC